MGIERELSKRRTGHEISYMQSKGRHNITCTRVSNSRNIYKIRDNTPNQWAEVVKLYRQNKELRK